MNACLCVIFLPRETVTQKKRVTHIVRLQFLPFQGPLKRFGRRLCALGNCQCALNDHRIIRCQSDSLARVLHGFLCFALARQGERQLAQGHWPVWRQRQSASSCLRCAFQVARRSGQSHPHHGNARILRRRTLRLIQRQRGFSQLTLADQIADAQQFMGERVVGDDVVGHGHGARSGTP